MVAVYALATVRYFPGRPLATLTATGVHLLRSVPFLAGLTLVAYVVLHRMSGERPDKEQTFRIFLTVGIFYELLYAIYHYLEMARING